MNIPARPRYKDIHLQWTHTLLLFLILLSTSHHPTPAFFQCICKTLTTPADDTALNAGAAAATRLELAARLPQCLVEAPPQDMDDAARRKHPAATTMARRAHLVSTTTTVGTSLRLDAVLLVTGRDARYRLDDRPPPYRRDYTPRRDRRPRSPRRPTDDRIARLRMDIEPRSDSPRVRDENRREQQLRRTALDSRRTERLLLDDLPDATTVPRDIAGHPVFPTAVADALDATYGKDKQEKQGRVFPKVIDELTLERTGLEWVVARRREGSGISQEYNHSPERLHYPPHDWGSYDPSIPESAYGSTQRSARTQSTTTAARLRTRRTRAPTPSRYRKPHLRTRMRLWPGPTDETTPPDDSPQAYLGAVELPRHEVTLTDAQGRAFVHQHPDVLVAPSACTSAREPLPKTSTAAPLVADVTAWVTINALAPRRDGSSIHRATSRGLQMNNFPPEHYPFAATNIGFGHIVCWFMQHGIDKGSAAILCLESFARARRNHMLHNDDVCAATFKDEWPYSPDDVKSATIGPDEHWNKLHHRPGATERSHGIPAIPWRPCRHYHGQRRPSPGAPTVPTPSASNADGEDEQRDAPSS
ncbi:hypothetical protein R3P38DRAFT_3237596 [Favolaschia claudopus]|uniref:Uncharacterized protein n=1 Tax=Favolaschia claudopus TaxID=2862362 RepID=A0AAV9ZBJ9_9AGAR